jgi:plastocyanin
MLHARVRTLAVAAATALLLAACGGGGDDTTDSADSADGADGGGEVLAVTGTDELLWDVESLSASAGTIEFELTCEDGVNHNLVIEETDEEVAECAPGETVTGSVELEAGTYTYLCTVPGHESRMIGELTVS